MTELNIFPGKDWKKKIIQLYETSLVRHGIMVVGAAGCGKSTVFKVLLNCLSNIEGYPKHTLLNLNPKSVTNA
jgi:dynein heavy chain